ncbi:HEAT repeat domain-containing protein [Aliivibrio kagoshimensis]|uniref:HEAT repeat domain-containing protein n=1 Tax=Aliivibrio kagoshimensis TaxID=2910230 RepID=UPI003D0D7D96
MLDELTKREVTKASNQLIKEKLIELLTTGDEALRCYAARAIGMGNVVEAQKQLDECLYHDDPDVVVDSADALVAIGSGDYASLCDVAKHHPESDARISAMTAIATQHLHDPQSPHHEDALTTLHGIATGRQNEDTWGMSSDWDDWWDLQLIAVKLLSDCELQSNLALFTELLTHDPEPELESALYNGIAKVSATHIIDQLDTATLMKKRRLARALTHSTEQIATVFLFKLLREEDDELVSIAIKSLCARGATEYQWDIIRCLKMPSAMIQKSVISEIDKLGSADQLDLERLFHFAQQADEAALPAIFDIISKHQGAINEKHNAWLSDVLLSSDESIVLATVEMIISKTSNHDEQHPLRDIAAERCYEMAQKRSLSLEHQTAFIRLLINFDYEHAKFEHSPYPLSLIDMINEERAGITLQQAIIEVMVQDQSGVARKWVRDLMFGFEEQSDVITSTQNQEEPANDGDNEVATLEQLLDQHDSALPSIEDSEQPPQVANTSTLSVIQQSNVVSMLHAEQVKPEKPIVEMVEELDPEFGEYSQIVKDHFNTSDNLQLNRRKIAKIPQATQRVLVIRSLGLLPKKASVELLIEALLGATVEEQREILLALSHIANKKRIPEVRSAIGSVGNAMHLGDPLTKQAATKLLAYLPLNKALPLFMVGISDKDEHVRCSSLMALKQQIEHKKIPASSRDSTISRLIYCFEDSAGGVRRLALQIVALIADDDDALESMIDLAITDEEANAIAATALYQQRDKVLPRLAQKMKLAEQQQQPLCIQLAGRLLAS